MSFDFDTPLDFDGADSLKWQRYTGQDVLPLWVADMDFRSPQPVIDALHDRVERGVFGYGHTLPSVTETVIEMCRREFDWAVEPDWLVWLPGLVCGLSVACRAVGEKGDGVMSPTPVYPPFLKVPANMDRQLETVSLSGGNDGWKLPPERLAAAVGPRTRLLLYCHPHNPVGRLWTETEMRDIAQVCLENRMVICSDEIHNQLILTTERKHRPLATLGPEVAARTITLLAPSKTFNIPGLGCSLAIIPDETLRRRYTQAMAGIVPHVNVLGMVAAEAAWRDGGPWLAALLDYLRGNRDYLQQRVTTLPGVNMAEVEATYLAWLDVSALGLTDPGGHCLRHGLGVSDGREFGGAGYLRLNFGCTRQTLVEACDRLERAVSAAEA